MSDINISNFSRIQGVDNSTEFVLLKKYKDSDNKSYEEWYDLLIDEFELGLKKILLNKSDNKNKKVIIPAV